MSDERIEFNPDIAYQQILQKRKQELLTEQARPQQMLYTGNHGNPYQQNRNPKFNPELDTKMTFDSRGNPMTINGKPVEEIESIKNAQLAAKLGMENDPNAIFQAKRYHKEVLQYHKQGVPAHLQMYGINEWAPVKEVKKFAKMVDLGDEAGASFQEQTRQLGEHIARKYPADSADALMHGLSGQTRQVAASMVENLALGKAKFLHNQGHAARPLITENQPAQSPFQFNSTMQPSPQPTRTAVAEGAIVYKILETAGMGIPCKLAKPVVQYNAVQHGMLNLTGRTNRTFIVQNEQARIDIGVIQSNPQFVKELIEVVDSRGGVFVVEQQYVTHSMPSGNPSQSKFLNDQYRPQTNQSPFSGLGNGSKPKFLKG